MRLERDLRWNVCWVFLFVSIVKLLPLFLETLFFLFVSFRLLGFLTLFKGLIERKRINLFQDGLESNQRLLKNLMPVVLRQINNDRNQHVESLILVGLQDVQEVVILEEAHSSVSHLQVDTSNAGHDSLEESLDQPRNFVNLADL